MNLYLLLVTLTIVNAGVVPGTECDGVIIDGKYYDREILKTELNHPFHLAVDYSTNIIYFSYHVNKTTYKSALFDINTKEVKDINDVPNGYTQTVDQNTHNVYIGGDNGIYKYDHKNHKSKLYAAKGKNISQLFFKDVLYISKQEDENRHVYTYINGRENMIHEISEYVDVKEFIIDGDDIIFYSQDDLGYYSNKDSDRLEAQKKGGDPYQDVTYSDTFRVRSLTVDIRGNAYMCSANTIYKINKNTMSLEKLMDIGDCHGLAFDSKNNMIYSDGNSLVRLKFHKDKNVRYGHHS